MSLLATLYPKEYEHGFKVIGTKKHTQFSEKPKKIQRDPCPFSSRTKEAGQWHRDQTMQFLARSKSPKTIYQILEHTIRPQSAQQKTLNSLVEDGMVSRSTPNQNKNIPVLYWITK